MTLGFVAAAKQENGVPLVIVVADSRISLSGSAPMDAGIKTYELGGRVAMVASGHALPALFASQLVRTIVENHNRHSKIPIGFYDTVRLLAFYLKLSAQDQWAKCSTDHPWACQVAVAGFLQNDLPCLAVVTVSKEYNRIFFQSLNSNKSIALVVGNDLGKSLLYQGFAAARKENKPVLTSGISLIWYMSSHPGRYPGTYPGIYSSIGGGISVGCCSRDSSNFDWPIIEIEGKCFLQGIDITDYIRPSWKKPEVIPYDESWCAKLDKKINRDQEVNPAIEMTAGRYDIDSISTPDILFQTCDDPPAFENGIPCLK